MGAQPSDPGRRTRFSGIVLVRVGWGEADLQVTDDGAELALSVVI